jgi:hypothetical protein
VQFELFMPLPIARAVPPAAFMCNRLALRC